MNFRNSRSESNDLQAIDGGLQAGNFPITSQPSIYSLTFGELQSTVGGLGKEFGSMNVDELVRNIWSSEEMQTKASTGKEGVSYFQKQGSLTLPRTLSQKTVEDVLKDITKEYALAIDDVGTGGGSGNGSTLQKQQTFREMTLEEFLVKAGAVREDTIFPGNQSNQVSILSSITQMNGNNVGGNPIPQSQQQQQQSSFSFSKQSTTSMTEANRFQLPLPSITRLSHLGTTEQGLNNGLLHGIGTVGLGGGTVKANQLSSDGVGRNNRFISAVPYAFNGSLRGRRSNGAAEKVAERRQKRMIKNRESAARSRARKQAYTTELEAEVAKLKDENQELQQKQAEIIELQKNQVAEVQWRPNKPCLRRTQTGPW